MTVVFSVNFGSVMLRLVSLKCDICQENALASHPSMTRVSHGSKVVLPLVELHSHELAILREHRAADPDLHSEMMG